MPDQPADPAELLAVSPRDPAAFEAFYRGHVRRVTAFAAQRCASAEDVADVVAETFARLLDAAERYDPSRSDPCSFLLGIAGNVVRDLYRRQTRHRALVFKLSGRDLLHPDDIDRVEAALDAVRSADRVERVATVVPPGEEAVLRLVAGGRTASEAAHDLGISPGAAWTRLSRARQRIRTALSRASEED